MRYRILGAMVLALALAGCGTGHCGGGCVLVGDYTQEEAKAVTEVTAAFQEVLGTEPDVMVNFVHSPGAMYRGARWENYHTGSEMSVNSEGYYGLWDSEHCMVLVRRYGEAVPIMRQILIHELLHALGYRHGEGMQETENFIKTHMEGN